MAKNNFLVLVGRDNWQKDAVINITLLEQLRKNNVEIIWEDPAAEAIYFIRKQAHRISLLPEIIKKCSLRITQIFYALMHPSYFLHLFRKKDNSISARCTSLKKTILKLGPAESIIVLSRSSGGRVASLIADELNIKCVICLGYPFKKPDKHEEPERYLHLASIKTPMLIIQGRHDAYGGNDVKDKYAFSEQIELLFLDADHDFNVGATTAHAITKKIEAFAGLRYNH